jgi:hypothetical protein
MWTKQWLLYHPKYSDVNLLKELDHAAINEVQNDTQEPHAKQLVMIIFVNGNGKEEG